MTDTLRTRIIAAIAKADQDWCSDNDLHEDMADAVIAELKLDTVEFLARSWYQNYDITPANDPRCPTDSDVAYDDAGYQILEALGLNRD